MDQSFVDIGRRVAELRARRGMTQQELHEVSGVGLRVVRKIEQGKPARMEAYHAIARVFGLKTLAFVPPSAGATRYKDLDDSEDLALAGWRSAIDPPVGWNGPLYEEHSDKPDLPALQRAFQYLVTTYRASRYDEVSRTAPALIRSAQFHVDAVPETQRLDAVRLRGEVLQLAGQYLTQVRQLELALQAFHAAIQDAKTLSDKELAATMIAGQAWALTRQGRFDEVERLCMAMATQVEPQMSSSHAYAFGAWGRLLVTAGCAAARNNRPHESREYMRLADAAAARIGDEANLHGNVFFGPITVNMRMAEIELVGGHPDLARDLCERPPRSGSTNPVGQQRHLLDYAHSLVLTGFSDKASDVMDKLRKDAPEWLSHQRFARVVMRDILRGRKRSYTEQQRGLIRFLGMENESAP